MRASMMHENVASSPFNDDEDDDDDFFDALDQY